MVLQNKLFDNSLAKSTISRDATSHNGIQSPAEENNGSGRKSKQLNVVHKKNSDGKILYLSARPNHFSYGPEASLWKVVPPENIQLLEKELRRSLKPKSRGAPKNTNYLRVAMVPQLQNSLSGRLC